MILVRRIFAVGLGVVFVATLMVSLVLIKLNGTLLEPYYYPDLLKRNDLYRFVMVDVLTTALDEARSLDSGQLGGNFRQNPLVTSGLTARQMTEAVHRGLSPQDLEMLAELAVLQIAEYATAERDRVLLTVDAGSHVKAVANEVHRLMLESGSYALFIEHELEPRVRQAAGDMLSADENASAWMIHLFGSSEAAEDRMVRVVMSALTPDWMAGQIAKALDELMPYMLGESDSFEVRIQFTDAEIETVVGEIKSILLEADAYEIEYLDYVRSVMEQGWTYSHHDLRDGLSGRGDALQALDQIRSFFREGYSYAYQAQAGHRSNDPVGSAMDRTRARLAMVSRYELPAYLLIPLLLIVIGLLGGTSLRTRVIWASSAVLISAVLVYVLSWPIHEPLANVAAEQARAEVGIQPGGPFGGTMQLIVARVGEVAKGVTEDIVRGVRLYSLLLVGVSGVVLVTAVIWGRVAGLVGRLQQS